MTNFEKQKQDAGTKRNTHIKMFIFAVLIIFAVVGCFFAMKKHGISGILGTDQESTIQGAGYEGEENEEHVDNADMNIDISPAPKEEVTAEQKEMMRTELCSTIIDTYGETSGEIFVSSEYAELKEWPRTAAGYITNVLVDLNEDGEDELLISYIDPESWGLWIEIYGFEGKEYECYQRHEIGSLNAFSQITLYLYKNESTGEYQVFYTDNSVGSYTGYSEVKARLFTVSDQRLEETKVWEWTDAVNSMEDAENLRTDMLDAGIRYVEAGKMSYGRFDREKQVMLAGSEVTVFGDQPAVYIVEMQILDHDQLQHLR